jgi:prepilin-type N-terminal cleavage/methylation domain-containing protein
MPGRIYNWGRDKRGVSLVELTVVLALLSVVLAVGYLFYGFGTRTFAAGEIRSNVQQQARLASSYIEKELRYAFEVQLLDLATFTVPAVVGDDFQYLFLNGDGALEHRTIDGSNVLFYFDDVRIDLLEFSVSPANNGILSYSLRAVSDIAPQEYRLATEVYIDNLKLSKNLIKNIAGTTGNAIRYIDDPLAPPSMLSLPAVLQAGTDLPADFFFTLITTFAKFNSGVMPWHFILGEQFAGLSVVAVDRRDASTVLLYVSGTVGGSEGSGTITVKKEALTLKDDLTATVVVTAPVTEE